MGSYAGYKVCARKSEGPGLMAASFANSNAECPNDMVHCGPPKQHVMCMPRKDDCPITELQLESEQIANQQHKVLKDPKR